MPASQQKAEVFISYAWGGESEQIAGEVEAALTARGFKVVRDQTGGLNYKDCIREFMRQIGRGSFVVPIIGDKYLRSPNCMFELVEIARNEQFVQRIFPIVLSDARIYDPLERVGYIQFWEERIQKLNEAIISLSDIADTGMDEELSFYKEVRKQIGGLAGQLKKMNTLSPQMHREEGFKSVYEGIERALEMQAAPPLPSAPVAVSPAEPDKKILPEAKRYTCDRIEQDTRFRSNLAGQPHFLYFWVLGGEEDSPKGLFERFALTYFNREAHLKKTIELQNASEPEEYKRAIVFSFFHECQAETKSLHYPEGFTLKNFLELSPAVKGREVILFQLKIRSSGWKDFTLDVIQWFIHHFCDRATAEAAGVRFVFFLNIIYEKPASRLVQLFRKDDAKRIKEGLEKTADPRLKDIVLLPELNPVPFKDVVAWFERNVTDDYLEREQLLKRFIRDRDEKRMVYVEEDLKRVIQAFNAGELKPA